MGQVCVAYSMCLHVGLYLADACSSTYPSLSMVQSSNARVGVTRSYSTANHNFHKDGELTGWKSPTREESRWRYTHIRRVVGVSAVSERLFSAFLVNVPMSKMY